MKKLLFLALSSFFIFSCTSEPAASGTGGSGVPTPPKPDVKVDVPTFSGDSAYAFVQKQVDFGPRVPKTKEHAACLAWLVESFKAYGANVQVQEGVMTSHLDPQMPIKNIIATINPAEKNRILLCAHWDTRYISDQEADPTKTKQPVLGADDGGSGVAVLLEIARVLQKTPIKLGVDIVLFDVEDQGEPQGGDDFKKIQMWCLGSQYWSKNNNNYRAQFGILLDMVGSRGASFPKEGVSMKHAGIYVDKVWGQALKMGYSDLFVSRQTNQIIDDHVFVNEFAKIPTIDIINLPENSKKGFGGHWHTQNDNMSIIDKNTLQAVGQVLLQVLYREAAGAL
jgi:glutaminyl-peptide cyclotransferase